MASRKNETRKPNQYFALWLDRTLTEREISGGELARAVGKSGGTVSRWRNGKLAVGLESVLKIAAFLDVDHIALLVTAGLMESEEARGAERLPLPEPTATVSRAREHIMRTPGLSNEDREALMRVINERYGTS